MTTLPWVQRRSGLLLAGRGALSPWHSWQKIVVSHASPGGSLAEQLGQWRLDGRQVEVLLAI